MAGVTLDVTTPAFSSIETALRQRLEAAFYQVGPALAPYMICDWQPWLWTRGLTAVFANFKWDSFHEQFAQRYGRGVVPTTRPASPLGGSGFPAP